MQIDEARRSPPASTLAVAGKGFRPFFLLAGAFATAIVPLWMLVLLGVAPLPAYLDPIGWHAHEMVFGFAVAVLAGFLLTAVGNWTGRETATGAPLLALAALWIAGRAAMLGAASLPRGAAAIVELAFLPALAATLARPLLATKNRRGLIFVVILGALFAADLATHLDALGVIGGWSRRASVVGVDVVALATMVISGRVFPMFTKNATGDETIRSLPKLDVLALAAAACFVALDAAAPASVACAGFAAAAGVLAIARSVHWGAQRSLRDPLLWVLHAGHAWLAFALILRAASRFTDAVPGPAATHAFTIGAIATLSLGMMSRVTLGHTGRMLVAPRRAALAFALVLVAAFARVAVPIAFPAQTRASIFVAGGAWTLAFALFLSAFAAALLAPRVDGRRG
jgi:uncharacterized protein involved in response to NO